MMSSIDLDALREAVDGVLSDWPFAPPDSAARHWTQTDAVLDAILPTVTQAILAAEQRAAERVTEGWRKQADELLAMGRKQAAQAITDRANEEEHGLTAFWFHEAARLARGGTTDE